MKSELIILAFLLGFYFCCIYKHNITEGFEPEEYGPQAYESNQYKVHSDKFNKDCPNLLLREGNVLHLINTRAPRIPGINPIVFNNLDEYVDYWEFQRENGIKCPVLYFQETYDAQNRKGYRLLVNPLEPNAGIDSVFKQKPERVKQLLSMLFQNPTSIKINSLVLILKTKLSVLKLMLIENNTLKTLCLKVGKDTNTLMKPFYPANLKVELENLMKNLY